MKKNTVIGDGPLRARVVTEATERARFAAELGREHFLGPRQPSGDSLYQVIEDPAGHWCGLLLWCSAGLHLKDRDAWIGWDALMRSRRLKLVVNNARFLIPDASRRPNLASRVLAVATAALPAQYHAHYGYRPLLAETFTDPRLHKGTCYQAAGWLAVGQTAGYGRQRAEFMLHHGAAKTIWVRPLDPRARQKLTIRTLGTEQAAAQTPGAPAHVVLKTAQRRSLREALHAVPDPRRREGQKHPSAALLTVVALGILGGAGTLSAIHRLVVNMTDAQRAQIGFRRDKRNPKRYPAPSYNAFWHLLSHLELDGLARALTGWLQEHAGALPRHLAMDGKDVRGALGMIVTLADAQSGIPVALAPAPGKGHEMKTAQQLLASEAVTLSGSTLSADALHCQVETAALITQHRGADYILQVKGNQPTTQSVVAAACLPADAPLLP